MLQGFRAGLRTAKTPTSFFRTIQNGVDVVSDKIPEALSFWASPVKDCIPSHVAGHRK